MPKEFLEGELLYYVGLGFVGECKVNKKCEGRLGAWMITFGGLSTSTEVLEERLWRTREEVVKAIDKDIDAFKELRSRYAA